MIVKTEAVHSALTAKDAVVETDNRSLKSPPLTTRMGWGKPGRWKLLYAELADTRKVDKDAHEALRRS